MINLLITLFLVPYSLTGTAYAGPKYDRNTTPLAADFSYFQRATQSDFWKLIPYYVPQHNDKSCGVASSIIVLNALFAPERNTSEGKNIDVDELFSLNSTYKAVSGPTGKGITLDQLSEAFTELFKKAPGGPFKVAAERFDGKDIQTEVKRLENILAENEKNPNDFIVVNFLQGVLTGDAEGMVGHLSPIGAYDAKNRKVLILDVDRKYYQPYWVGVEKLLSAMNTADPTSGKKRGLILVSRK